MQLDPNQSLEHWHGWLREEAERVWGAERTAQLAPAIQRMVTALQRVVSFELRAETAPHNPGATTAGPKGSHDA